MMQCLYATTCRFRFQSDSHYIHAFSRACLGKFKFNQTTSTTVPSTVDENAETTGLAMDRVTTYRHALIDRHRATTSVHTARHPAPFKQCDIGSSSAVLSLSLS